MLKRNREKKAKLDAQEKLKALKERSSNMGSRPPSAVSSAGAITAQRPPSSISSSSNESVQRMNGTKDTNITLNKSNLISEKSRPKSGKTVTYADSVASSKPNLIHPSQLPEETQKAIERNMKIRRDMENGISFRTRMKRNMHVNPASLSSRKSSTQISCGEEEPCTKPNIAVSNY